MQIKRTVQTPVFSPELTEKRRTYAASQSCRHVRGNSCFFKKTWQSVCQKLWCKGEAKICMSGYVIWLTVYQNLNFLKMDRFICCFYRGENNDLHVLIGLKMKLGFFWLSHFFQIYLASFIHSPVIALLEPWFKTPLSEKTNVCLVVVSLIRIYAPDKNT